MKEWLHFCVCDPRFHLLVNFSCVDDVSTKRGSALSRTIVLFHDGAAWSGDVVKERPDQVEMRGGQVGLRFGTGSVEYADGSYRLRATSARLGLEVDLCLAAVSAASPLLNVAVPNGPPINWAVVPRLIASGTVRKDGRTLAVAQAPAYHDHNFGTFRWGDDFAWEWGYGLPHDPDNPWSLVLVRLANLGHTVAFSQGILLWHRGRQRRFFINGEVTTSHEGLLRPTRMCKIPAPMALLKPGLATDVPSKYRMVARRDDDVLTCTFQFEDVAQVVIPNDKDLGVTVINEVSGRFEANGRIDGEPLHARGSGVFEFLGR